MQKIILLLLMATTLIACQKQYKDVNIDYHYGYYPLEVGITKIYEVDSVKYSPVFEDGKKAFHSELKEVVAEAFIDAGGREAFRIERYVRRDSTKPWAPVKSWYAVKEKQRVEQVENNLRFVRLIFPLKASATWNGNAYIAAENNDTLDYFLDWEYEVTTLHGPATVNGVEYDSTVTVLEVDDENLLERRYSTATFAKGTGLVFREQYNLEIVDSQLPSTSIPWEEKANRGYTFTMKLKRVE